MIRKHLVAGILFWVPVVVTVLTIRLLLDLFTSAFRGLPKDLQPDYWLGFHIPGIELVVIILLVWLSGVVVANIVGKKLVGIGEAVVNKIPLIRSVYSGVKQTLQIMASPNSQAFRKVVLVSFPQPGSWAVGLVTHTDDSEQLFTVFIPTTPNPTSGYVVTVAQKDAKELDMSVDEALKYIISLGTISHEALINKFKILSEEIEK